jgi:hypothetical protein
MADATAAALWREQAAHRDYPTGVVPVPEPIAGTAFFPGGYGLFDHFATAPMPPFPFGGVMVLGHDFHSVRQYELSRQRGFERPTQPTWRHLLALLADAGIPPAGCFFTNVFMGLREGAATTGPFPGRHAPDFVAFCRRFLLRQLAVQRPRLILTLGIHAPHVLAPLSPELAAWRDRQGLKVLDTAGPVQGPVRFAGLAGFHTTVVALTHPCLRPAAVRHRRFAGFSGAAAERAMIARAKAMSGG